MISYATNQNVIVENFYGKRARLQILVNKSSWQKKRDIKCSLLCYHSRRKSLYRMPPKVRQVKAALSKAGFSVRPGKGSHTVWTHPALPDEEITLSGKDGSDAKPYQIKDIQKLIERLKGK